MHGLFLSRGSACRSCADTQYLSRIKKSATVVPGVETFTCLFHNYLHFLSTTSAKFFVDSKFGLRKKIAFIFKGSSNNSIMTSWTCTAISPLFVLIQKAISEF